MSRLHVEATRLFNTVKAFADKFYLAENNGTMSYGEFPLASKSWAKGQYSPQNRKALSILCFFGNPLMQRRSFFSFVLSPIAFSLLEPNSLAQAEDDAPDIEKIIKSDEEWLTILTPEQFNILREEGTEPPLFESLKFREASGDVCLRGMSVALIHVGYEVQQRYGVAQFFHIH